MSSDIGWIGQALLDLDATLNKKNQDYKIDSEFSNFEFASMVSGIKPLDVMAVQVGIKLGRLKGLAHEPLNESRLDTYKDLAGYAIIMYAYMLSLQADEGDNSGARKS